MVKQMFHVFLKHLFTVNIFVMCLKGYGYRFVDCVYDQYLMLDVLDGICILLIRRKNVLLHNTEVYTFFSPARHIKCSMTNYGLFYLLLFYVLGFVLLIIIIF